MRSFVGDLIHWIKSFSASLLDGAGWHGSASLVVPDNISLLTLPPYSPEPCVAKNSPLDCFLNAPHPSKTSGPTCAPTRSQSPSSKPTTKSSMPAAKPGASSPTTQWPSFPQPHVLGHRSDERAVGITHPKAWSRIFLISEITLKRPKSMDEQASTRPIPRRSGIGPMPTEMETVILSQVMGGGSEGVVSCRSPEGQTTAHFPSHIRWHTVKR